MEIYLENVHLTDKGISRLKDILGQLETVKIRESHFCGGNNEFYESFLQSCTDIKRLYIQDTWNDGNEAIIGANNSWLLRQYPTLENVELIPLKCRAINELQTFFEQNPQIKSFAIDVDTILANRDTFKNTNAKWDILSVRLYTTENLQTITSNL